MCNRCRRKERWVFVGDEISEGALQSEFQMFGEPIVNEVNDVNLVEFFAQIRR